MQKFYKKEDVQKLRFYQVPKVLVEREQYRDLGLAEKLVYGVLLDRTLLSIKNNWFDENGYAYILFSGENLGDILNVHEKTARRYINNLKKYGLLEEKRMGRGMSNRIYLVQPDYIEKDIIQKEQKVTSSYPQAQSIDINKKEQNVPSRRNERFPLEGTKCSPNDTDISDTDFNDDRSIDQKEIKEILFEWTTTTNELIHNDEDVFQKIAYFIYKFGKDKIILAIEEISKSDYLLGNINGLPIKLQWFLIESNFIKVLNGNYRNKKEVKKETKKNKFHNFKQRSDNYTEDELEKVAKRKRKEHFQRINANKPIENTSLDLLCQNVQVGKSNISNEKVFENNNLFNQSIKNR